MDETYMRMLLNKVTVMARIRRFPMMSDTPLRVHALRL